MIVSNDNTMIFQYIPYIWLSPLLRLAASVCLQRRISHFYSPKIQHISNGIQHISQELMS